LRAGVKYKPVEMATMAGLTSIEGLSTEAKIGKVVVLISIILSTIAIIFVIFIGTFALDMLLAIPGIWVTGIFVVALVKVIGVALGVLSLQMTAEKRWKRAGIYALIASVVPPLDLLMLLGGIFFLTSPEASSQS
jgi:hypothetical protein